jgi:hypothetical protein
MAVDAKKIMDIYSAISEIGSIADDIRQADAGAVQWVFDNYDVDPDKLLAATEIVLDFLACYEALEEAEDERRLEEHRQKQEGKGEGAGA